MTFKFQKRGYKLVRDRIEKNARYNRSCTNCVDFYKTKEDDEEVCQNSNVLEFDICVEGERVYCSFWRSLKEVKNG